MYPSKTSISAITMGWGTLSSGGPTSGQLQNVRLNIYDGNKCDSVVKNYPKNWTAQICAGEPSRLHALISTLNILYS